MYDKNFNQWTSPSQPQQTQPMVQRYDYKVEEEFEQRSPYYIQVAQGSHIGTSDNHYDCQQPPPQYFEAIMAVAQATTQDNPASSYRPFVSKRPQYSSCRFYGGYHQQMNHFRETKIVPTISIKQGKMNFRLPVESTTL
ncbi:hypothetical protein SNE40_008438 [Patella caerulea]|uniref:Uncharacterized protein n=1 Tax=Patella caerulea TaxID=87958 RepID=A0AAN8JZQ1_PATCE